MPASPGTFAVLAEDMRGEGDHRGTRPGIVRFPLAQLVRGLETVEHRHLTIHQHQVVRLSLDRLQRFLAVAGGIRLQVELVQHAADDLGGNAVVLGNQDAEVTGDLQRRQGAALWAWPVLAACLALREFVGQSGLEGVAGHRFGQDALDPGVAGDDLAGALLMPVSMISRMSWLRLESS